MLNDLNCNMVRCWGGNVYEDDEFYDLCDRNGVMVWQDFALGCARYPQDDEFAARMEKEAKFIVKKFRNRASLALWAGDNEIDISRTWIVDMTQHDPNLDRISRQVLAGVVRDQDPLRDYLPSSPYVSPEVFKAGFDRMMMPEIHLWGPRGYFKAEFYTDVPSHFVSEIGYHGCPDRSSLERMFDKKYVEPDYRNRKWNEQWQAKAVVTHAGNRTKNYTKRNDLMPNQVEALFGTLPDRFDDFIFASQVDPGGGEKVLHRVLAVAEIPEDRDPVVEPPGRMADPLGRDRRLLLLQETGLRLHQAGADRRLRPRHRRQGRQASGGRRQRHPQTGPGEGRRRRCGHGTGAFPFRFFGGGEREDDGRNHPGDPCPADVADPL